MAVEIVATDLMVCVDCLEAIEYTDDELGYTPGTLFAHMKRILHVWPQASHGRFVNEGTEPETFSTSACDGCGSYMAGGRFEYTLLAS